LYYKTALFPPSKFFNWHLTQREKQNNYSHMIRCIMSIFSFICEALVLSLILPRVTFAFLPTANQNGYFHKISASGSGSGSGQQQNAPKLHMVGDFLSGITGNAPSSLQPSQSLLENTNIDPSKANVDLKCVYKASRDGFSAVDFHNCCDGRGSGLVVILTSSGKKFGGFNPLGWESTDDYGNTNAAFLFFERNGQPVKCNVLSGGNAAIFDYATGGPQFGSVS